MQGDSKHPLITGARITGIGTLASRMLGLVRDMAIASVLGMSGSAVADAFVIAFRLPNLFRRLFGEGALTASYQPIFTRQWESDRSKAWQLASVLFTWLTIFLSGLTVLGEVIFLVWGLAGTDSPNLTLLLKLSAITLPYVTFICLAAQMTATLQTLSNFVVPAWTPTLLNVCMILAAWLIAPRFTGNPESQAVVLAVAVLVGGAVQVLAQWPSLRKAGFRFDYNVSGASENLRKIGRMLTPMLVGLAVTQLNTLGDSLIAWFFEAHQGVTTKLDWLGGVACPMQQGAAAALYYGERMYEFPLGIIGAAVATAILPLLSRHAARGDHRQLASDLSLGLRMVLALGIPAGIGLMMLAHPLNQLILEHGHFTPHDTARAATTTACYAVSVWAYCATLVVVRGYYALGDSRTPVRIAVRMVALDLLLNLSLIWPFAEAGLAISTSLVSIVQLVLLLVLFVRKYAPLPWNELFVAGGRALVASGVMAGICSLSLSCLPADNHLQRELFRVGVPMVSGGLGYLVVYRLLGGREIAMLFR